MEECSYSAASGALHRTSASLRALTVTLPGGPRARRDKLATQALSRQRGSCDIFGKVKMKIAS